MSDAQLSAPTNVPIIELGGASESPERLAREIEDIRNQGTALTERLLTVKDRKNDEAIRKEIGQIAARMIALTAAQEGDASPLPALIAECAECQRSPELSKSRQRPDEPAENA